MKKILKVSVLIALVGVSIYFMYECIQKFAKKSTSFELNYQKKNSIESPTVTICFGPAFKQSVLDIYNFTQDFGQNLIPLNISIEKSYYNSAFTVDTLKSLFSFAFKFYEFFLFR